MPPRDRLEHQLSQAWVRINRNVFGGALLSPAIVRLVDMEHHAADWGSTRREIRFSQSFVRSQPWAITVEVLKHEMAHQYVSDVLGIEDETAHGPAFQRVCQMYGIDARASGVTRTEEELRVIEKVRKLFNLGQSPNENESRAALRKAEQLLKDNNLSEKDVDPVAGADEYGIAILGPVVLRKTPESFRSAAAMILSDCFGVRCIWINTLDASGTPGLQLEACGRRSDLLIAEHVHAFLHAEAERAWSEKGPGGARNRQDFLEGVMTGHYNALKAERGTTKPAKEAIVHQLVSDELKDYYDRRYPRTSGIRGSQRKRGEMYSHGVGVGEKLRVNPPVGAESGPKLLR